MWIGAGSDLGPIAKGVAQVLISSRDATKPARPPAADCTDLSPKIIGAIPAQRALQLMVTDSGSRFWDAVTDIPFEKIDATPETRALLQRTMFFEHQPYITRWSSSPRPTRQLPRLLVRALYGLGLGSDSWHHVQHACFFATALLFWRPVILPWPARPSWPRWAVIPYLALAELQNSTLAAILTFAERVIIWPMRPLLGGGISPHSRTSPSPA